jgi:TubC N-terminal docking domain
MTASALVAELRARGVELIPAGDRLRFRPASAVPPDLVEHLRRHKAEVLVLLTQPIVTLDAKTVSEVLGPRADEHAVACVRLDVRAAVHELEAGIRAGVLPPRRLIHGRPLADWLDLGDVAWLLRAVTRP